MYKQIYQSTQYNPESAVHFVTNLGVREVGRYWNVVGDNVAPINTQINTQRSRVGSILKPSNNFSAKQIVDPLESVDPMFMGFPVSMPLGPDIDLNAEELMAGGRRKECKGKGLKGKEKRACAKELKASGWKKGQPLPPGYDAAVADEAATLTDADMREGKGSGTNKILMYAGIGVAAAAVIGTIMYVVLAKKS